MNTKSPEVVALIEKLKSNHTPLKDSTTVHEDWSIIFSSKHYVLIIKTDPPIEPSKNFEIRGKHLTGENTVADVVEALKL
ncbi:MAG TPA: hypothetical protein VGF86_00585 [Candidatus Tumulicola sp.]